MRQPLLISVAIAMLLTGCSRHAPAQLSFQSPADWKVAHQTFGGYTAYTISAQPPTQGSLLLAQWPSPAAPQDISRMVKQLADAYVREEASRPAAPKLASQKYQLEQFSGEHCQGSCAIFQLSPGPNTVQVFFMISVDGKIWDGQFNGSSDAWNQSLAVLKSLQPKS